jgi:acetate kinase
MTHVLTLNGGSSSIRFALYDARDTAQKILGGKIDRIGTKDATLSVEEAQHGAVARSESPVEAGDHGSAAQFLMAYVAKLPAFAAVRAVGHRIVHGMQHSRPARVTPALLAELREIIPYDPEHLPRELELIETVGRLHPGLEQAACFDTAFHRTMPRVATLLPIPRRYAAKGLQRYGFHGLSYTFLMGELRRIGDPAAVRGRVVLAHLGGGASLAAVRDGRCIDTSMGFTPTSGLVMSTRSGDLDPGVSGFLARTESMDAAAFQTMVTHASGLLGVSETSADIRDLLAREAEDVRAAEAVALFCYQIKKWIGAFAAALGGLDTLVFAGGIGENAAAVRERVCEGLQYLGVRMDPARNARGASLVSHDAGAVAVRVIRTDEESVIADSTVRLLKISEEPRP